MHNRNQDNEPLKVPYWSSWYFKLSFSHQSFLLKEAGKGLTENSWKWCKIGLGTYDRVDWIFLTDIDSGLGV